VKFALVFVVLLFATVANAQTQTAHFTLTWRDGGGPNPADTYHIERSPSTTGPFQEIATTPAPAQPNYSDSIPNDPGGKIYCYRVRSSNAAGFSGYSNTACAVTQPVTQPIPISPTSLTLQQQPAT